MNGKITEFKQPQDQSNSKMGDHLGSKHFVFFSVAEILGKLAKILLISLNYDKTQLTSPYQCLTSLLTVRLARSKMKYIRGFFFSNSC